ncbi:helix-turn-helix transcriptional regulator [Anaerosporobacter sp.]
MRKGKYIELKAYRARCELNQEAVGKMIGVNASSYSHKENGTAAFSLEEAFTITSKLNSILEKKGLETTNMEKLFVRN